MCLTCIEFFESIEPVTFYPELAQLPGLQRLVLSLLGEPCDEPDLGPVRLPADMGPLSSTLQHLEMQMNGHMGTLFPSSLTQLVALEHLNILQNDFAKLPAGITALSRLTELMLGRLHEMRTLDVRALGDLSRFPALCKLTFDTCQVKLCRSLLGAARHASLTSLNFYNAKPARAAPRAAVLQLSQELWRQGRGSVLTCVCGSPEHRDERQAAQYRRACQRFMEELEACRLGLCGL